VYKLIKERVTSLWLSQFHGHGSWLVCEVALRCIDMDLKGTARRATVVTLSARGHNTLMPLVPAHLPKPGLQLPSGPLTQPCYHA
jgi:hypothetical protein